MYNEKTELGILLEKLKNKKLEEEILVDNTATNRRITSNE